MNLFFSQTVEKKQENDIFFLMLSNISLKTQQKAQKQQTLENVWARPLQMLLSKKSLSTSLKNCKQKTGYSRMERSFTWDISGRKKSGVPNIFCKPEIEITTENSMERGVQIY
jgi:hypothetical protein